MRISIRNKVTIASVAIFALAGGATGVGIWSAKTLAENGAATTRSAQVLRNHMQADMMHDALRADVLAALLSENKSAGIGLDGVRADLAEHVGTFRQMIDDNKALATEGEIRAVLASVEPPLLKYIGSATAIIDLAEKDPAAAIKSLPDFMAQF